MGYENASGVQPNEGSLFFITKDNIKNPLKIITPVNISNGLVWNDRNDEMFYIDTPTRQVKRYSYDGESGKITNETIIFDMNNYDNITGYPDGMTIDKDNNLWIALYNGGAVIKVNSKTGQLLDVVAIPALHVTSVAWGGSNLDTLFVTTSRFALERSTQLQQPAAGSLFAVNNLETRGLHSHQADILNSYTI